MRQIVCFVMVTTFLILNSAVFSHDREFHKPGEVDRKYARKVNWKSLEEGLKILESLKKPLLQKNVYSNDEIAEKINSHFIPIFINLANPLTSQEITLGEKYDYENDCLLLFLDHKSEVIQAPDGGEMCYAGKIETQRFIDYLDYIRQRHDYTQGAKDSGVPGF
jgi:hypothetical protein